MKKLWAIILISMIGLSFNITSSDTDKKSLRFDPNTSVGKANKNIELLVLVDDILDKVENDVSSTKRNTHGHQIQKDAVIKKAKQDIIHLKRIKQHLKNLEVTEDDMQNETRKEIRAYKETKQNLINSAQRDIDSLIKIENHLIRLEEDDTTNQEKAKENHRRHKHSVIERVKVKIEHLLRIERELVELTKNHPKEHREAETIYYETEYLKGPEIHDRETFSIEDAQYHDHLHKDISTYTPDYHEKIKNYLWSNT